MYIEEVLIINFLIDYVILYVMSLILNNNINNKRILLCSLIGEATLLLLFIDVSYVIINILKLLFGAFIIFIYSGKCDRKTYFTNLIWFYSISFLLGGFLYYIKINVNNYILYLILVPIILNIYRYFIRDYIKNISFKHKVNIYLDSGNVLCLNGFMDTGNNLIDPYYGKKVIIIDRDVDTECFLVPYENVGGRSLIKCFKPHKVFIEGYGERSDVVVGITKNKFNGFDCLLNYGLEE